MKLIKARVENFRSAEDTGEFDINDLTCLVGKNEAGKTTVLKALNGIRAINGEEYELISDYPRRFYARYEERHNGEAARVSQTTWKLDNKDIAALEEKFGQGCMSTDTFKITSRYSEGNYWNLSVDEQKIVKHLIAQHDVKGTESTKLGKSKNISELRAAIDALEEKSSHVQELSNEINAYRDKRADLAIIDLLYKRTPKFFYTSHFDRMSGEVSIAKLKDDKQHGRKISPSDQIFLDFLEYAGTSLEELEGATRLEELNAKCQAASNDITEEIFEFWSQNDALSVEITLAQGLRNDPPPFNSGTVAKIRIHNANHRVSVPLSERSAGFIWFFSFLAQFKQMRKKNAGAIILLDEPGLTLHGKAQADLLRYVIERLLPEHQVIFSTHSPFMVPSDRLEDVRVVEDIIERDERNRPIVKGTKVSSDVLSVDKDTLFPLQAHLGYEITQSLFIGANTLLVEGPSDILYLQAASAELKKRNREGLSPKWTICPSGGIDKISPFATLFRGKGINIAVLCDYGDGDKTKVQKLRASQILKSEGIFVATDFTGKTESDIEDFFTPQLFSAIVNSAYELKGKQAIGPAKLTEDGALTRQVKQMEALFNLLESSVPEFDHFTPASWLIRNQDVLAKDEPAVNDSLDRFEKAFKEINKLLPK